MPSQKNQQKLNKNYYRKSLNKFSELPIASAKSIESNTSYTDLSQKYNKKLSSMQLTNNKSKRILFRKIVKKMQERAESFYKYGFKSYQKKNNRDIFQDLFKLPKDRLSGTISVGELWSNKQSINYLKENRMFLNKSKLVQQLQILKDQVIKKQKKQINKNKTLFFPAPSPHSLLINNRKIQKFNFQHKYNTTKSMNSIKNQLYLLNENNHQGQTLMKNLKKCQQSLQKIQKKYQRIVNRFQ